jgi:hypothetical protein
MRLWNTVLPKTSQWKTIRSVLVLIAPKERFPGTKVISFSNSPNPFLSFYFPKLWKPKESNIVSSGTFQTTIVTILILIRLFDSRFPIRNGSIILSEPRR